VVVGLKIVKLGTICKSISISCKLCLSIQRSGSYILQKAPHCKARSFKVKNKASRCASVSKTSLQS
jgi:hypothetical protein